MSGRPRSGQHFAPSAGSAAVAGTSRVESRSRPGLPGVATLLLPPERRWGTPSVYVFTFLVTSALAFLRLGSTAWHGRIWAEDGQIFLQQALTQGSFKSFTTPYAGYLDLLPRLLAGIIHLFPVSWAGLLLSLAAAVVQGWVATIAFVVIAAHTRGRAVPVLGALLLAAVPVGLETIDNIANLQWYLWFGASVALFFDSRGWWVAAIAVTVTASVGSSPFGFTVLVLAAARWLVKRDRRSVTYFGAGVLGAIYQIYGILIAPTRSVDPKLRSTIPRGFLHRVLGDAVFGTAHYRSPIGTFWLPGTATLAFIVLAGVALWLRGKRASLVFPALLLVLSFMVYVPPQILNPLPVDQWAAAGRYYVAPALFLVMALVVMVGALVDTSLPDRSGQAEDAPPPPTSGSMSPLLTLSRLLSVAVCACLVYGWGSVFIHTVRHNPYPSDVPDWSTVVDQQVSFCSGKPGVTPVSLPVNPPGWFVDLNCGQLLQARGAHL